MMWRAALATLALALAGCQVSAQTSAPAVEAPIPYLTLDELRESYADANSNFITIKGLDIHYKDEGRGPVLLMVHGSQSSLKTWDVITDMLKDDYRIIRYDIPGYGLSGPVTDEAMGNATPTDLAIGLLDALEVDTVTAIGTSSGGTLVAFLASEYPDRVDRLIVSNMPSDPVVTTHLVMPESFLAAQARTKQNNGFMDEDFWHEYHTFFAGVPERISEKTLGEYYDFGRRPREKHPVGMVSVIGDGVESSKKLRAITQPTLLIWGSSDPLLPRPAAEKLEAYLENADVSRVFLEDVGHYPPLESPERVGTLIEAYLKTAGDN
jgi:haloalkane dehalogenase